MLLYLTLPVSGDETYHFTDKILEIARSYYPDEDVFLAGKLRLNEYDFEKSFAVDNTVVSIVSVLIVLVVLLFTFNSAGMPLLLILVIQGSIWINFSFPTITGKYLFFLGYLVVSSIQMGANIDYAIVIGSRYQELKAKMTKKVAIIDTLNFAFPTIITSGSILAISGFLIGNLTSEPVIAGIGESLGRGTVISIFLLMLVLPQILLTGTAFIDKTSFSMPGVSVGEHRALSGKVFVNGMVRGHISGNVRGQICAMVDGDVDLNVISGSADEESDAPGDDTPPDGGNPDDHGAAEVAPEESGRGKSVMFNCAKKLLSLLLVLSLLLALPMTAPAAEEDEKTISVSSAEDLIDAPESCKLDTWSEGVTVELEADVSLEGVAFSPIASFSGTFHGNGHTISGLSLSEGLSLAGLFQRVQKDALIEDLNVSGTVKASSTCE